MELGYFKHYFKVIPIDNKWLYVILASLGILLMIGGTLFSAWFFVLFGMLWTAIFTTVVLIGPKTINDWEGFEAQWEFGKSEKEESGRKTPQKPELFSYHGLKTGFNVLVKFTIILTVLAVIGPHIDSSVFTILALIGFVGIILETLRKFWIYV